VDQWQEDNGIGPSKSDFQAALDDLKKYPEETDNRDIYKIMAEIKPVLSPTGVMFSVLSKHSTDGTAVYKAFDDIGSERTNFGWVTILFFAAWVSVSQSLIRLCLSDNKQ